MRDEKLHAVVARSTSPSQNAQSTPFSDHFWKLRCRKSARRCGAKHMSKSKCTKQQGFGPLLEVAMSKKCTPLWREAHVEVKMYKAPGVWTTWKLRCRKSARRCGAKHISKSKCTKHQGFGPLLEVQILLGVAGARDCAPCQKCAKPEGFVTFSTTTTTTPHYTPIHYNYNDLHYIPLHYTPLHYTQVHSITLNYTTPHYITLQYTPLHYITLHYLPLHYVTLHYATFRYTTLRYTTLCYLPLHYITLHYTPLHYNYNYTTTLHYTPLH